MNKVKYSFLAAAALTLTATACVDLSDIESRIDKLETDMTELSAQAAANKNALAVLSSAVNNGYSIVSYQQVENGYQINFTQGDPIIIFNGQNGKDGQNGQNGQDGKDGVNGQDGKDGKDGIDGANGKDGLNGGESMFEDIVFTDSYAVFYLVDGSVIVLPVKNDFADPEVIAKWTIQTEESAASFAKTWNTPDKATATVYGKSGTIFSTEGAGTIWFNNACGVAADKFGNTRLDVNANDPRAYGAWPGDYCEFKSPTPVAAGKWINIKFETRVSKTNPKYWELQYLDGLHWKPVKTLLTSNEELLGDNQCQYTHVMANDGSTNIKVDETVCYENNTNYVAFRFICKSSLQSNGAAVINEPNGGTWRLAVTGDDPAWQPAIRWASAPAVTPVHGAVILRTGFTPAEFNMISEGGFEDYPDKPLNYRTAWLWMGDAYNRTSYADEVFEGKSTVSMMNSVGGLWLDINQFVAFPHNTELEYSFIESVNTPYMRNWFFGEGGSKGEENLFNMEAREFTTWDMSDYRAWDYTLPKKYSGTFNTGDHPWGIAIFSLAGDPKRELLLDDVRLAPKGYQGMSVNTNGTTMLGTIQSAAPERITGLEKGLAWINENGELMVILSQVTIDGVLYDTAIAVADPTTFAITEFVKNAGEIAPAYKSADASVISIVPDNVFVAGGKSYMHYYAVDVRENRDAWQTKFSGVLVSEDGGRSWAAPAHGGVWNVWLESKGNEQKAPYEWFSEASICLVGDYYYMVHGKWGRDWSNYSSFFASRCPASEDMTDPTKWEHWTGDVWSASEHDVIDDSKVTIGNTSEPCLYFNKKYQRFMLIYRSERHGGLVMRDAASVEGPWSGEKIISADDKHGYCVAPSVVSENPDGSINIVSSLL